MLTELVVGERLLDEALAIVKGATHGHRGDVVAERRHLRLLDVGDLSLRVQHDHSRAGNAVERLGDCATRIA